MPANTIDEVITALEAIIKESLATNSRIGYFAALYHKVTTSVKHGIDTGQFQDGKRMEQLDVLFANRYLEAYTRYKNGQQPTASWQLAFQATQKATPLVLQQLLLGMSAHINLDLGIAAVAVCGNNPLQDIHTDFDSINTIISSLTYQVLADLGRVSPLLSLLGLHAGNNTSVLIQFSIDNARDGAWCFAEELYAMPATQREAGIVQRDKNIHQLGENLANPTGFLKFTTWFIHLFEWKKPSNIIRVLYDGKKRHFTTDTTNKA